MLVETLTFTWHLKNLMSFRAATAGKAGKAGKVWSLPRFWVPIQSYKKQWIKKKLGRILDLAWRPCP